jgi:hypothetical protein
VIVRYALAVDVLRHFDPSLSQADLATEDYIGRQDLEQVRARLESASDEFDRNTGRAFRLRRVGAPSDPATWEYHDARRTSHRFPLRVDLDHGDIVPLDPDAGDALEIRTGRDTYEDITAEQGDSFYLDRATGELKLYQLLVNRLFFEAADERYARLTYRYGGLGGGRSRGGQTTLTGDVDAATTTLAVANASRLPADGGIVRVGPFDDPEYVRVTGVDPAAGELTVTRGQRATVATTHDAGDPVHYCPLDIRDAVAGLAAAELVRYDTFIQQVDEDDDGIDPGTKVEQWNARFDDACAQYSGVRRL